tara:strand:- start:95 stop:1468 length:1374 start_codon:yes stop_codon:yes gene_type:complete
MRRSIIYLILTIGPLFAQVDYYTQIQTIFNDNCTSCHINGGAYYAGLDLANYDSLMLGSNNGDVVIPGDHASSLLWQEIDNGNMPPGNNDDLSYEEIDLIAQWIDEGALESPSNNPSLTYLNIDPDTIEVSEGAISVTVTMGANDYNSDLEVGSIVFTNPSNSQTVVGNINFENSSSDTSSTDVTILQYSENGVWVIYYIELYDSEGNVTTHYTSELSSLGFETELYVISSPVDDTDPTLTYFSLDPDTLNVNDGLIELNISLGAMDDLSGLSAGSVVFNSPSNSIVVGNINYNGNLTDTLFTVIDNQQYEDLNEVGNWQVYYISVYDIIGNETTYYTSELDSLGYETGFFIEDALGNNKVALLPKRVTLYQNYPNPFNPFTTIDYDLLDDVMVKISIYDMNGNLVRNLLRENQTAGHRSVKWNATNQNGQPISAGVYLYSIEADGLIQTKKMIFLK